MLRRMVDAENVPPRRHCIERLGGPARSNAEIKDCVVGSYLQCARIAIALDWRFNIPISHPMR